MKLPENFLSLGIPVAQVKDALEGKRWLSIVKIVGLVGSRIPSECALRHVMFCSTEWRRTGEYHHEVDHDATVWKGRRKIVQRIVSQLQSMGYLRAKEVAGVKCYSLDLIRIAERAKQSRERMDARKHIGPKQTILLVDIVISTGRKQEILLLKCGHWIIRDAKCKSRTQKWARCPDCKAEVAPYHTVGSCPENPQPSS